MLSMIARLVKRADRPRRVVTLYGRAGCSCCEKARALLESKRDRLGFELVEIDVDSDPALAERHGLSVPVVEIDGKVRFRGVVNPVLLERALAGEPAEA
jgi:glutaredoxin